MHDKWQYVTPETKKSRKRKDGEITAVRAKRFQDQFGQQKTDPSTPIGTSRLSLKRSILIAPWSSIVSWAFLVSGLVIYSLNASKVSTNTQLILDITGSHANLYNKHLETITSTSIVSIILGIISISVGAIAAWIHVKDILGGSRWGSATRLILNSFLTVGLLYLFACFSWFFVIINYLSSWCTGLWILEICSANITMEIEEKNGIAQGCAATCLNLHDFPFLNTSSCICEPGELIQIHQIAASTRAKAVWFYVGVICIMVGLLTSMVNISADIGCIHKPGIPGIIRNDTGEGSMLEDRVEMQKARIKISGLTPDSIQPRSRITT